MYTKVYVVTDQTAIEFLQNDDLEGFKQYLSEDETLDFGDPIYFSGEASLSFPNVRLSCHDLSSKSTFY